MPPLETRTDSPGETPEVPQDPCQHWRGILRFRRTCRPPLETRTDSPGETQKYPTINVSTEEECSGSGTDSTQDFTPQHRRERNPERPPSNSHGDWPFLGPPVRVLEVPAVSREHLPQLEKIQEVLPSR